MTLLLGIDTSKNVSLISYTIFKSLKILLMKCFQVNISVELAKKFIGMGLI